MRTKALPASIWHKQKEQFFGCKHSTSVCGHLNSESALIHLQIWALLSETRSIVIINF